ncbi:MAG: hypothetical protein IPK26_15410 [Planctomycetes bacterium]|nr:hypothetical protein [Planctomycetota bacterium]
MRFVVAACVVLVGCTMSPRLGVPATIADLPWSSAPRDRAIVQARAAHERGLPDEALRLCDSALREDPRHVDALRLRQDLLRVRGRTALLRAEVEQMLRRAPEDPIAHYLRGRLLPDPRDRLAAFERATELAPDALWGWLGMAFVLRESNPSAALALYSELHRATDGHPIVAVAMAQTLKEAGQHPAAARMYEQLRGHPDLPGVGDLGLAQTALASEARRQAWPALMAAVRQRPFDPAVRKLVREWLRVGLPDEQVDQLGDILREDPQRWSAFASGDGVGVAVALLSRLQRPQQAQTLLATASPVTAQPVLRRALRRLQLGQGDVIGYLRTLAEDAPWFLFDDERNQARSLWLALLRGPWLRDGRIADAAHAVALLAAMRDAGLLADAELAGDALARSFPGAPALQAVRDEIGRELAFEGALRRLLYQGYEAATTPTLDAVLAQTRELSQLILGRDVVGEVVAFELPLVGRMLDPFATGLCRHFARYNKHLVLGQRSGGPVEGLLFCRWAVRELEDDPDLPLPTRCFEVVGGEREVRSFTGVTGGDLAGVALLNHFVVDWDAVRDWGWSIAERRRIAAADAGALLRDPLPQDVGPTEGLDVAWRLAVLSPVQDSGLDAAVYDTIRRHERQHLVDSFHFLPIEANLWRGLGLLLEFGLSPAAIEAEMERRAELASLVLSPHTELVLAHIADFLADEVGDSPHGRGFTRLALQLVDELASQGIDRAVAHPARWHQLEREAVRRSARVLLQQTR